MPLIEKYDAETGDFIEVLPGVKTAASELACSVVTVWRHLDKPTPINGFLLKRGPDGNKERRDKAREFHRYHVKEPSYSLTDKRRRDVIRVSLDDDMEVRTFRSIKDAAESVGVTESSIARAARCQPGYEVVAGYAWAFVYED